MTDLPSEDPSVRRLAPDEEAEEAQKIFDSMSRIMLAQEWETLITAVGDKDKPKSELEPAIVVRMIGRFNNSLDVDVHDSIWGIEDLRRFAVTLLTQCKMAEEAGDPSTWKDLSIEPIPVVPEESDENP